MSDRDEFSPTTIRDLQGRAAFLCSNPKDREFKPHFLEIPRRRPSDKNHSVDFNVFALIAAAFYIEIMSLDMA